MIMCLAFTLPFAAGKLAACPLSNPQIQIP
jgi:hypothetical protein